RVPRHRGRRQERRSEARDQGRARGPPGPEPVPTRDETDGGQGRERVVEEVDRPVHDHEAFRIEAADQPEEDEGDRRREHRDDEIVRSVGRTPEQLISDENERREDEDGREHRKQAGLRADRSREEARLRVPEDDGEADGRGDPSARDGRGKPLSDPSFRGPAHREEERGHEDDDPEEESEGIRGEEVRQVRQLHRRVVCPCGHGQRRTRRDIEGKRLDREASARDGSSLCEDDQGGDSAERQQRCEWMQEREEEKKDERERPVSHVPPFGEQEEDDRKHEKADRLFRDGTREQEETPEDRDEEARGDAEREGTERERDQSRTEGNAHEGREDRAVDFQPRRTTSKDCGGSTAGASRIEPEGRSRNAAWRSPRPESVDIATIARTINAKVTGSNVTRTSWPKTSRLALGASRASPRNPTAAPITPAATATGSASTRNRRRIQRFPAPPARNTP